MMTYNAKLDRWEVLNIHGVVLAWCIGSMTKEERRAWNKTLFWTYNPDSRRE